MGFDKSNRQRAIEIGIYLWIVVWLAVVISIGYTAAHFIGKYW